MDPNALIRLNDACWAAIAARASRPDGHRVDIPPFVAAEAVEHESRFSRDFPVMRHLDAALALARRCDLAELAGAFARVAPGLAWSQNPSYTEANCTRSFLDGYAYAALSGPEGPIHCAAPRGGFMIMGPDVTYPDHHHEPREVYLVLTPGTQWRLDRGEWFDVEAGDLIFHRPWQMHAMRTRGEPLLAFAGWVEPGSRLGIGWAAVPNAATG